MYETLELKVKIYTLLNEVKTILKTQTKNFDQCHSDCDKLKKKIMHTITN